MGSKTFPADAVNLFVGTPADALTGSTTIRMKTRKYYIDGTPLLPTVSYTVNAAWADNAIKRGWAEMAGKKDEALMNPRSQNSAQTQLTARLQAMKGSFTPLTLAGTYAATGSGVSQDITTDWRPSLVIVKSDKATTACIWTSNSNWHGRCDFFNGTDSIGAQGCITLLDTGFRVTGPANDDTLTPETYAWFAYCDNYTDSLLQTSYHGNAVANREFAPFELTELAACWIKRDASDRAVFSVYGGGSAQSDGAVAQATITANGTVILGATDAVNEWNGFFGEGHAFMAVPKNSQAVSASTYLGTAAIRRLPVSWDLEAFLVFPLDATGSATVARFWCSAMAAGEIYSTNASAKVTNELTSVGPESMVLQTGGTGGMNQNGKRYGMIQFRKLRQGAVNIPRLELKSQAVVQLTSGYVIAGGHPSLEITGSHTLEWYGALANSNALPTGIASIPNTSAADTQTNSQFPLISRSVGADRTDGAVNYCLELCIGQSYQPAAGAPNGWQGVVPIIARGSNWKLRYSADGGVDLDEYPINTGVRYSGGYAHYAYSQDANGKGVLTENGRPVKYWDHPGQINILPRAGQVMVFGGRLRGTGTPEFGSSQGIRTVRVYNRALTEAELLQNYLSHFVGFPEAVPDFVEEWQAKNGSGTSMPATNNAANNGVITAGLVMGV